MELTSFQNPQIRDSNNNIIQEGAYGKYSAFANVQNTGILDYINNNLQVHDNQINLLLASSNEYTDISSINDTLTNISNLAGGKQDRLIAGDNITIDGNVISSLGGGDVAKEEFEDLKRSNDALWKLTQGIAWDFETSTDEAYTKQIPSGAICFDLKMLGGKSVVANQCILSVIPNTRTVNGVTFTKNADNTVTVNGAATADAFVSVSVALLGNHTYLLKGCPSGGGSSSYRMYFATTVTLNVMDAGRGVVGVAKASGNSQLVIFVPKDLTVTNLVFKPQCIDLTQMFGAGNEPTLEQCQQIFTEYIPYTEPTLVNHKITDVVVRGKNLFDKDIETKSNIYCINASTVTLLNNNSHWRTKFVKIPKGVTKLTCSVGNQNIPQNDSVQYCLCNNTVAGSEAKYLGATRFNTNSPATNKQTFDVAGWEYIGVQLYDTLIVMFDQVQIEIGDTYTNYVPYVATQTKQVPQAIRDIEGNGWSAGSVYNYIDLERKKFVKCVEKHTITSDDKLVREHWALGQNGWYKTFTDVSQNLIGYKQAGQILIPKYPYSPTTWTIGCSGVTSSGNLWVGENTLDGNEFRLSLVGQTWYYELETPQEIDIDLDDRFSAILCEGNGSITFEGSTDYKLPIANTEEFLVKLSEV